MAAIFMASYYQAAFCIASGQTEADWKSVLKEEKVAVVGVGAIVDDEELEEVAERLGVAVAGIGPVIESESWIRCRLPKDRGA